MVSVKTINYMLTDSLYFLFLFFSLPSRWFLTDKLLGKMKVLYLKQWNMCLAGNIQEEITHQAGQGLNYTTGIRS